MSLLGNLFAQIGYGCPYWEIIDLVLHSNRNNDKAKPV